MNNNNVWCCTNGQRDMTCCKDKAYALDCMHDQQFVLIDKLNEVENGMGGSNQYKYIVRRLTPLECCRLQGFPDFWCENLGEENPSEDEIEFFENIFEEKRQMTGNTVKPKTRNQIIKWLKNPQSDSAEYRMWGNGVALPCVYFVLSGIAWWDKLTNIKNNK